MIINSHVHINTDKNYFFYNNYGIEHFLTEMNESNIDFALPMLNPKLSIFRCPNDCSMRCTILNSEITSGVNNNLNSCNCSNPKRHRVGIFEESDKFEDSEKLVLRCKTCGKIILKSSVDPLRNYNIALMNLTKPYRAKMRPLIYLSLCKSTIQAEIDFFENAYGNEFAGFKLHPWNDQVSVDSFRVHTNKPILIHTGMRSLESGANAISFAENNPNVKIVIAHAGALDETCLRKIAVLKNVFVDCCPSTFMFKAKYSSLFYPEEIKAPEDIYYKVLNFVPSNKILFGSDSPWGNSKDELTVISRLQISESIREQILYKNAVRLYGLDCG